MCVEICIQGSCGKHSFIQGFNNNQGLQPWLLDLAYHAGFCFESIKSIKLTSNCLLVTVWGGYFSVQSLVKRKLAYLEFTVRMVRYWSKLFVESPSVGIFSA